MPRTRSFPPRLAAAAWLAAALLTASVAAATSDCAYFHNYIGQNPGGDRPGWHDEAQGVSHDETHWYLSQKNRIWRVPAGQDLSISPPPPPPFTPPNPKPYLRCRGTDPLPWAPSSLEVPCAGIPDELEVFGRDHFGDITVHDGYLFVPTDGNAGVHIAVFRADDTLAYVGADFLDGLLSLGWLAIDPAGKLYASRRVGALQEFLVYELDWDLLKDHGEVQIEYSHELLVRDENDQRLLLTRMQGGVFSDDGQQLYLVNGFTDEEKPEDDEDTWGIHVFEMTHRDPIPGCNALPEECLPVARRVARSTNGSGPFNYDFNPGYLTRQEPEGATYWDLDAPGAPQTGGETSLGLAVGGQLHVMMLNNNAFADQVYLKHYTAEVACEPMPGLRLNPRALDFGQVGVMGSKVELLQIANEGDAALTLFDLILGPEGGPFSFATEPFPPIALPPGSSTTVHLRFAPTTGGPLRGSIVVLSDDHDDGFLVVPLAGIGRTLVEQAQDLVTAFDNGVAFGTLSGTGPGKSADNRLAAFRSMLEEAVRLLEAELVEEACGQLHAALLHVDGEPRPSDFVTGPAAGELADEIRTLRARLGC